MFQHANASSTVPLLHSLLRSFPEEIPSLVSALLRGNFQTFRTDVVLSPPQETRSSINLLVNGQSLSKSGAEMTFVYFSKRELLHSGLP
ncbi:MAG: hypothetical protein R2778_05610 [Saprospiraceae bacterium]